MSRLVRDVLVILAVATAYYVSGRISFAAAAAHHVISSVWVPAGIALFALLHFGLRAWPGVALGAFALNATSGVTPGGALIISAGNTLEGVVAALLLTRVAAFHRSLDRVRDVIALVGLAAGSGTLVAAAIGVTSLVLTGDANSADAVRLWLVWWAGDAVGIIVVTPLLLTWTEPETDAPLSSMRALEQGVTFAALVLASIALFHSEAGLAYLIFPMIAWIALRLGRRGGATAATIVMIIATDQTVLGAGPFTRFSLLGNLYVLQLFLVVLSVMSMLFAAFRAESQSAQTRLEESEARYRMLARNLPDAAVTLFDGDLRLLVVEGPAVAAAGFSKAQVEGALISDVFPDGEGAPLASAFRLAFEGRTSEFEFSYRDRIYLVRVLPLSDSAGRTWMGMALALDITQRYLSERELDESRARLQALSRQLLAAQEDERRHIAREVHDELGQTLSGVKMGLSALKTRPRRTSLETGHQLDIMTNAIDGALDAVRRIVLRLRPGVLDNLGPLAALEWEVQEFTQHSGIPVHLTFPDEPIVLDGVRSTTLYRTLQESLTNVMRHAGATSVDVTLQRFGSVLVLQITDNGRGIGETEMRKPRSMGLLGMRERAVACGGSLEIRRAKPGGTEIVLNIPYDERGAMRA